MAGLADGRFARAEPPDGKARPLGNEELHDILALISRWDANAWFAHRERYAGTYGPLPLLPPECQNAVVLQATLGHADGQTFGLSRAAEPYVRSVEEFAQHVEDVAQLWGRRLHQSRLIFLAGDDVLHQPAQQVAGYLERIGETFPIGRKGDAGDISFEGVHAFVDDFNGLALDREGWRRLRERGLNRVSLGVESGDPKIRIHYGKHWSDEEFRRAVGEIKAAGLGVSILTLVCAGGIEGAGDHVDGRPRLIASLDLAPGRFRVPPRRE